MSVADSGGPEWRFKRREVPNRGGLASDRAAVRNGPCGPPRGRVSRRGGLPRPKAALASPSQRWPTRAARGRNSPHQSQAITIGNTA
ncbi:hypothetical protein SH528x_000226 [Novipirellula sp. SH528]|uniref:hypothetical protein n=1 Tax=Novipirellula sp. SH528 TaxID=3454466 RepID=UPI003F9ED4A6